MKQIPLTQGKIALVSDVDYARLNRYRWYAHFTRDGWYAQTGRRGRWMHRMVLGVRTFCDHRNGDGLDNRRRNLRRATRSQNMANRKRNADNRSGFKGVGFHRPSGMWRARVQYRGLRKHLGLFGSKITAAAAYAKAARSLHKQFARTQ